MEHTSPKLETIVQRLCAPNDINGNPRRVWMLYYPGSKPLALDEEYSGTPQQVRALIDYVRLPDVHVRHIEYRRFCRDFAPRRS